MSTEELKGFVLGVVSAYNEAARMADDRKLHKLALYIRERAKIFSEAYQYEDR